MTSCLITTEQHFVRVGKGYGDSGNERRELMRCRAQSIFLWTTPMRVGENPQ